MLESDRSQSIAARRSHYRRLMRKGEFNKVCPVPGCGAIITELHQWSVKYEHCRAHVEVFKPTANPTSLKMLHRAANDEHIFLNVENCVPRGRISNRKAWTLIAESAYVEKWYQWYDLMLFFKPPLFCHVCESHDTELFLFRNWISCRECVKQSENPGREARHIRSFVGRRTSVHDVIELLLLEHPDVQEATRPEKVARKIRSMLWQQWLDSFYARYGEKALPSRMFQLRDGVQAAWYAGRLWEGYVPHEQ